MTLVWLASFCLLPCLAANFPADTELEPTVLWPLNRTSGLEVALIVLPEGGVDSSAYRPLGRAIQEECSNNLQLWVGLIQLNKYDGVQYLEHKINSTVRKLRELGMTSTHIFLSGHGRGGIELQILATVRRKLMKGIILFGSYLHDGFKYEDPAAPPVLTLSGDLDGITRITRVAKSFKKVTDLISFDQELLVKSPVVVLNGLNHGSFSNHTLLPTMKALDLRAEVEPAKARKIVAHHVSIFILYNTQISFKIMHYGEREMKKWNEESKRILEPFLIMWENEVDSNYHSSWIKTAQIWLSGLQGVQSQRLIVESHVIDSKNDFEANASALFGYHGIASVVTFSSFVKQPQSFYNGAEVQSPVEVLARMISAERIRSILGNTSITYSFSCKDLNYAAFMTAFSMCSQTAIDRYNRQHKGVLFHKDHMVSTKGQWNTGKLLVEWSNSEQHVTSTAWRSKEGLYYCVLLPPSRAMEWIYVDSLSELSSQ